MLFNIISNEPIYNLFHNQFSKVKLYHTFDCAALKSTPSYLNNKINNNEFWAEDINEFIKSFLEAELNKCDIKPLISVQDFEFSIEIENEFLFLNGTDIFILDKRISRYFGEEYNFKCKKIDFEIILKSRGNLNVSFNDIVIQLKKYFGNKYKYYIPVLYKILINDNEIYKPRLFEDILFSKNYLESIKIYNVESDFKLKKDLNGLYLQSEYSEYLTGRLGQTTNSLQTLSKEKRNILVADKNCYLIELDFRAFEYNILLDLHNLPKPKDPHTDILKLLKVPHLDRAFGKSINYSFIYGKSIQAIVDSFKNVHNILLDYDLLMQHPLAELELEIRNENEIVYTYFNRPIKINKSWAVLNNFIQATAADIFFKKFREIISILPKDRYNKIILQNHDSYLIQLHEDEIKKGLAKSILKIIKQPLEIFTFSIDVKFGKIWGELS